MTHKVSSYRQLSSFDEEGLPAEFYFLVFIFQTFFNSGAMASVRDAFCIYHVTAPGQESGAEDLGDGYAYPTMDELSEQVN